MISDTLFEAITEIERYQRDFSHDYGESKEAIEKVKVVMNALRSYLDCPPSGRYPRYDAAVEHLRHQIGAIVVEEVAAALENIKASWPTPEEVDTAKMKDKANEQLS